MKTFSENILFNNRQLTISGTFDRRREVVDHVGWLQNGEIREKDIYGYVVHEKDIDIISIVEYFETMDCEKEVKLSYDELIEVAEILAGILTEQA